MPYPCLLEEGVRGLGFTLTLSFEIGEKGLSQVFIRGLSPRLLGPYHLWAVSYLSLCVSSFCWVP